ncbi:glycerophosphodiester phosphodiesterase [Cytobacillus sp. Hz8]|uniref:glycerophosphodiester phosphodiesterase n=1 Tax=Cytobacillus sp. Hz8 TaxID=3347168 RepID=UPI0035D5E3AA
MTLILAHRGYSAKYPENTMKAFMEAHKAGADGIELDVQLTKDEEIVIIHDEKVDRTTNGKGFVKDFSLNEIKKIDAGYHKLGGLRKEPIPTLQEVFDWLKTNDLICNIEFKNGRFPYKGMEEKVISLVRDYQLSNRIIFSSFNHYSIVYCYRLAPEIEIAPLYLEGLYMPWIYAQSIRAKGIHPRFEAAPDFLVKASMEAGIQVRPFTVNKEDEIKRLIKVDCSAIITDDPVKALRIRREMKKS